MPIYVAKNNKRMGDYFPSIYENIENRKAIFNNSETKGFRVEMEMRKMDEKRKAEANYWAGDIRASVWKNEGKDKDNKKIEFLSVKVIKAYKDDAGNWKDTNSFSTSDLLNMAAVCQKVYADLRIFKKEN